MQTTHPNQGEGKSLIVGSNNYRRTGIPIDCLLSYVITGLSSPILFDGTFSLAPLFCLVVMYYIILFWQSIRNRLYDGMQREKHRHICMSDAWQEECKCIRARHFLFVFLPRLYMQCIHT